MNDKTSTQVRVRFADYRRDSVLNRRVADRKWNKSDNMCDTVR